MIRVHFTEKADSFGLEQCAAMVIGDTMYELGSALEVWKKMLELLVRKVRWRRMSLV